MLTALRRRKAASVLFDESHAEAWSIRPEASSSMRPAHPEASSYSAAASALEAGDFNVAAHTSGPLDDEVLAGVDVLVIAHPSEAKWSVLWERAHRV